MTPRAALTPTQQRVLDFINEFRAREQCNPTCLEIAQKFGWASPNAANDHLLAMELRGVIERRLHKGSRRYIVKAPHSERSPT